MASMRFEGWSWRAAPKLGGVIADRGNNLDLLRLLAAVLVLWGHAPFFSAPENAGEIDPFSWITGGREYAGSVAVHGFFLISGMLITASMERRSTPAFALSRFARIWPGFVACVAVLIYLVVPLASGIPLLSHAHLKEAGACLRDTLAFPWHAYCDSLAGAFPLSRMGDTFGFPYWTLATEVDCYGVVLLVGLAFGGRMSATPGRTALYLATVGALSAAFVAVSADPPGEMSRFYYDFAVLGGYSLAPVASFLVGMAFYGLRDRLRVWPPLALLLAGTALLPGAPLALDYAALFYGILALAGAQPLRRLRPRHDLSFGVYIYGAAMQQVALTITGPAPPWANFAVAAPLSLLFAYGSSRLVEEPAIALGRRVARAAIWRGRFRTRPSVERPKDSALASGGGAVGPR